MAWLPKAQGDLLGPAKTVGHGFFYMGAFYGFECCQRSQAGPKKVVFGVLRLQIPKFYFEIQNFLGIGCFRIQNRFKSIFIH